MNKNVIAVLAVTMALLATAATRHRATLPPGSTLPLSRNSRKIRIRFGMKTSFIAGEIWKREAGPPSPAVKVRSSTCPKLGTAAGKTTPPPRETEAPVPAGTSKEPEGAWQPWQACVSARATMFSGVRLLPIRFSSASTCPRNFPP